MSTAVTVGGGRDVRATLDGNAGGACVVACPPHPRHRGSRSDERLRAVSRALVDRGVDCLRFDYGPWAEGEGEVRDAVNAVRHARGELGHERVALFGYSFGGCVAFLAAADLWETDTDAAGGDTDAAATRPAAVSALAPARRLAADLDAVAAVGSLSIPMQVVAGARDTTVEWEPVADAVRRRDGDCVELPADHFFVGQAGTAAEVVAPFLARSLG
ncbi:alpha/beta hydrolase [Salinigranum salinum]|uniref:alpha/beta hydrolase n=1 Tax=Salinigranum salinum TaxID=1364937 RepID=UPI0012608C1C|nr:alpha/beta hydrolase [Salinigranum salinum]